jgi:hypothetical protein
VCILRQSEPLGSIKASTTAQCERLEQVSNDLQDRFAWRVMLRVVAGSCWLSAMEFASAIIGFGELLLMAQSR